MKFAAFSKRSSQIYLHFNVKMIKRENVQIFKTLK